MYLNPPRTAAAAAIISLMSANNYNRDFFAPIDFLSFISKQPKPISQPIRDELLLLFFKFQLQKLQQNNVYYTKKRIK